MTNATNTPATLTTFTSAPVDPDNFRYAVFLVQTGGSFRYGIGDLRSGRVFVSLQALPYGTSPEGRAKAAAAVKTYAGELGSYMPVAGAKLARGEKIPEYLSCGLTFNRTAAEWSDMGANVTAYEIPA